MKIPVFHDDQHGTAIVVGAALLNGLAVAGKDIRRSSWSPPRRAAALACLGLLMKARRAAAEHLGHRPGRRGLPGPHRLMEPDKTEFAQPTDQRTLAQVIEGADVFLGLSAAGVLKPGWCSRWRRGR
jgi:malate dehydrogenase (oxaloacetate-decarboxylating)(NADP+)